MFAVHNMVTSARMGGAGSVVRISVVVGRVMGGGVMVGIGVGVTGVGRGGLRARGVGGVGGGGPGCDVRRHPPRHHPHPLRHLTGGEGGAPLARLGSRSSGRGSGRGRSSQRSCY